MFRILIADDNPSVRNALRQLFEGLPRPSKFIEATDGKEAVSKAVEFRPDVVILDLAMPEMDGLTAARHILRSLPQTPVFLCTMFWSAQLDAEAKAVGVRSVVSKAESSTLIAAVEQLLNSKVAASPSPAAVESNNALTTPTDVSPRIRRSE